MSKPKYEVAQIIEQFGDDFVSQYNPNTWSLRTLNALQVCRTAALGGHKEKCDCCGKIRISYNSCRNRHCPKCQAVKQAIWVEDTSQRIIDTKYFHVVFTVPEELNTICLFDCKSFYSVLFASVWNTLHAFGYTHYGVESGALSILHTWGQNLSLHPHIHCLVPAAGLTLDGKFRSISKKGKYLHDVKMMSKAFRDNMLKRLKKQLRNRGQLCGYQPTIDKAWSKQWVVFSEPSFSDAEHVIKYLGQYTHRVAISNHRILNIDQHNVSFHYKEYSHQGKVKPTTLSGVEFLRRFCMHICKRNTDRLQEKENVNQRLKRLTGFDMFKCPFCKKGQMYTLEVLPRIRSPAKFIQVGPKCL